MALNRLSSFVPQSKTTPLWLPVVLACFLLQTLIPNGYMPGNLSSGEGALVFCGDTAFLDPDEPDVSELLKDSHSSDFGFAHGDSPHKGHSHAVTFSDFSHCLFSLGGQLDQTSPILLFHSKQFAHDFGLFPATIDVLTTDPDFIRPLLRAPPYLSS